MSSEAIDVADLKARVTNLEGWQKSQNGSIHRVEAKVDRIPWWFLGQAVLIILGLAGLHAIK